MEYIRLFLNPSSCPGLDLPRLMSSIRDVRRSRRAAAARSARRRSRRRFFDGDMMKSLTPHPYKMGHTASVNTPAAIEGSQVANLNDGGPSLPYQLCLPSDPTLLIPQGKVWTIGIIYLIRPIRSVQMVCIYPQNRLFYSPEKVRTLRPTSDVIR